MRFSKEEIEVRKKSSYVAPHALSERLKPYSSTKGTLWVFRHYLKGFSWKCFVHVLNILHFLSLKYSADFRRSGLVTWSWDFIKFRVISIHNDFIHVIKCKLASFSRTSFENRWINQISSRGVKVWKRSNLVYAGQMRANYFKGSS